MRNQLVTVFGGTGFIGRHLVRRLAGQGARVLVVSRNPARGNVLQPMGRVGQIVVERVDLASEQALARALAGSSAVVNLMGILYETRQQKFARRPWRAARAHREGRRGGRDRADGSPVGDRRRSRFDQRLCAQQGGWREAGARGAARGHDPAALAS